MVKRAQVVALVESPAQLLNVLEWAYQNRAATGRGSGSLPADRFGEQLAIKILPPPGTAARVQLDRMTDVATAAGCTVSWHEARGGQGVRLRTLRKLHSAVSSADTVIIGDPFSGFLQLVASVCRIRELVVVDDGSASIRFVEIMESGEELVRWHRLDKRTRFNRMIAARARRRMAPGASLIRPHRPMRLFTAMPVDSQVIRIARNTLAWTRQLEPAPRLLEGSDLIGSSLVETGVVSQEHYLHAVAAMVARQQVKRYLAHRREGNEKLSAIAALGVEVVRPGLPLELFARQGPIAERLISFPSTVVHTLPLALSDTRVQVVVCDIDHAWLTPGLSAVRSGSFLTSVTTSARRTHGLSSVVPV